MTEAEERIQKDLAAQIKEPVLEVRPIPQGHSGFTYWVELDGHRGVLRLPPPGARIAGPGPGFDRPGPVSTKSAPNCADEISNCASVASFSVENSSAFAAG